MSVETKTWDAATFLKTPEDIAAYLNAAFETGEASLIAAALGDVSRSEGMTAVASRAGVTREALYKSLSENGDPKLSTLLGVVHALNLRLEIAQSTKTAA